MLCYSPLLYVIQCVCNTVCTSELITSYVYHSKSSYYYRKMIEHILGLPSRSIPIIAYVDNKSVIEAVYSTKLVDDKHLKIDMTAISESLKTNDVNDIRWCTGKDQFANCMTKHGASGYELLTILNSGKMIRDFAA